MKVVCALYIRTEHSFCEPLPSPTHDPVRGVCSTGPLCLKLFSIWGIQMASMRLGRDGITDVSWIICTRRI